jgi:pentatricopeptide repeat protein
MEVSTFVALLKECMKKKDPAQCCTIHSEILRRGLLQESPHVASSLISMYAKCGMFAKANQVLEDIHNPNIVYWNALISGYIQYGQDHDALMCLGRLQSHGLSPNVVTFICILKACGNIGDIEKGKEIHESIVKRDLLATDILLGTSLLDMYVKCGMLASARNVFEVLPFRDSVAWNALISGYAHHDEGIESLSLFSRMHLEALSATIITFVCIIKACGQVESFSRGKQIHAIVAYLGLLEKNIMLGNAVVGMYAKVRMLGNALEVLDDLPIQNVITWNALIGGYVQIGRGHEALTCFQQMQHEGLSPDVVTFICVLKACGSLAAIENGRRIHDEIMQRGLVTTDVMLGTALVDMYAKCGMLVKAQQVLDELPVRNVVSWNALIAGYSQEGPFDQALSSFRRMQIEGLVPDTITFISLLKACGSMGAVDKGKRFHSDLMRSGFLDDNILIGNALVDMYAKCGMLAKAHEVIEQLPIRDVISWSALISGYVQEDRGHEAVACFDQMQSEGISPDVVTFLCILKAYGDMGAVQKAAGIRAELDSKGLLGKDMRLETALIDMYSRCDMISEARQVLEELPLRDAVSWNALISAYSQRGESRLALNSLEVMQLEGVPPDTVTFLSVLSAFSHSGLLSETERLLNDMRECHGLAPTIEHHSCIVAGLGCAGRFEEAISAANRMAARSRASAAIWLPILGACRRWGNAKGALSVFDQILQHDASPAAAYVLMADILAGIGMQSDAKKVESMRLHSVCS